MFMHVCMSVGTRVCSCTCTCVHGEARGSCQVSCSTILPFFTQTGLSLASEPDNLAAPAIQLTSVILSLLPKGWDCRPFLCWCLCGFWGSEPWSSGLHSQYFTHRACSPASFVSFPQRSPKNAPSSVVGSCLASLMCLSFPGRAKQPLHLINFNRLSAGVLCVWIVLSGSL